MTALANGLDYIDLEFLGQRGLIATGMLHGPAGVALIDPGPSTTLPVLERVLAAKGFLVADIRAILLTHIHLDHAGGTGTLLRGCPSAEVFVHERGAPHVINPSKLMASASRLYGADMERLWGEVRPVPERCVRVLGETARLHIVGHDLDVAWTPGHAWHHVSFFHAASGIAFVGDTGGICRPTGRVVLPPAPPPDIDLEAWRESTRRILAWRPEVLFLTHFGPQPAPRVHFQDLWQRIDDWSARVKASLAQPGTDEERSRRFVETVVNDLQRAASAAEAEAYARAARFDFSWSGLARYWRKRGEKSAK
jgi:glyoxylase-like metal-dependent hydrolase (beta-lactamase superfamily II)